MGVVACCVRIGKMMKYIESCPMIGRCLVKFAVLAVSATYINRMTPICTQIFSGPYREAKTPQFWKALMLWTVFYGRQRNLDASRYRHVASR